jgi:hypothetical protein
MLKIGLATGKQVIDRDDVVTFCQQCIAKMGAKEASTASHQYTHLAISFLVRTEQDLSSSQCTCYFGQPGNRCCLFCLANAMPSQLPLPSHFHFLQMPIKRAVSLRLDADVVAWLKREGSGYQTRANRILRERMLVESRKRAWAAAQFPPFS